MEQLLILEITPAVRQHRFGGLFRYTHTPPLLERCVNYSFRLHDELNTPWDMNQVVHYISEMNDKKPV